MPTVRRMMAVAVMAIAAVFAASAGLAQARSYPLSNCPKGPGQDQYAVTPLAPGGCAFGKAAYRPLLTFSLTGTRRGSVAIRYRRRNYKLACSVTHYGQLVQCGIVGKPYVRLYLDSGSAPAGYPWPTHT